MWQMQDEEDAIKICGCLATWKNLSKGQRVCGEARARGRCFVVRDSVDVSDWAISRRTGSSDIAFGAIMKPGSAFFLAFLLRGS